MWRRWDAVGQVGHAGSRRAAELTPRREAWQRWTTSTTPGLYHWGEMSAHCATWRRHAESQSHIRSNSRSQTRSDDVVPAWFVGANQHLDEHPPVLALWAGNARGRLLAAQVCRRRHRIGDCARWWTAPKFARDVMRLLESLLLIQIERVASSGTASAHPFGTCGAPGKPGEHSRKLPVNPTGKPSEAVVSPRATQRSCLLYLGGT